MMMNERVEEEEGLHLFPFVYMLLFAMKTSLQSESSIQQQSLSQSFHLFSVLISEVVQTSK